PLLVEFFLNKYGQKMGIKARLADDVIERLMTYSFQGNVRELENMVEQAVALAAGGVITLDDILPESKWLPEAPAPRTPAGNVDAAEGRAGLEALKSASGTRERAAGVPGISPTTPWRKMTRLGVVYDPKPSRAVRTELFAYSIPEEL